MLINKIVNNKRYFSLAFEQNDKIALSQNCYVRGEDEEELVSFEKGKDFNTAKKKKQDWHEKSNRKGRKYGELS